MTRDEAAKVLRLARGSKLMADIDTLKNRAMPWQAAGMCAAGLSIGVHIDAPPLARIVISAVALALAVYPFRFNLLLRDRIRAHKAEEEQAEADLLRFDAEVFELVDDDGQARTFTDREALIRHVVAKAVAQGDVPAEATEALVADGLAKFDSFLAYVKARGEPTPPPMAQRH